MAKMTTTKLQSGILSKTAKNNARYWLLERFTEWLVNGGLFFGGRKEPKRNENGRDEYSL
jgi:hypothetical protein